MADYWSQYINRIAAGEDVEAVLDEKSKADRACFDYYIRVELGRPDLADEYAVKMRELDLGIAGARSTWAALSAIQKRALKDASEHGGRLERVHKCYRHRDRHQAFRSIYVATIRNLCARELLVWDGGAFDPEAAAVLTERGQFVLRHGEPPQEPRRQSRPPKTGDKN